MRYKIAKGSTFLIDENKTTATGFLCLRQGNIIDLWQNKAIVVSGLQIAVNQGINNIFYDVAKQKVTLTGTENDKVIRLITVSLEDGLITEV